MTNKIPDFHIDFLDQNKGGAFAGKQMGKMSMGHAVKLDFQPAEGAAGSQRGLFFQRVRSFFGNLFQNIGGKIAADRPNIKLHDRKLEVDGKVNNIFNRIQLNQGSVPLKQPPISVDKPMATVTDRRTGGVETPMNIDKIMTTSAKLQPEEVKQLKSQFVSENLGGLRTKDLRHLLSVGKVHGIENKEEGEIHLSWAMELIGHLVKEFMADKPDEGDMQVLQGILAKLEAGTEFARVLEQKYSNGVSDETLKEAANRLIANIDNTPAIFQVGCDEHCVGLEVERGDDGKVHVRISNVGYGVSKLYNPEVFQDNDNKEINAYIPTYEFACDDDTIAEELIFNLMKAFNEDIDPGQMYECFNKTGIDHVSPPDDKVYYRPQQNIGNCVFRNVFEAAYNCLQRNDIPPENLQNYVFAYAKEAVNNGDVYPELQKAAEEITPPQFFMK